MVGWRSRSSSLRQGKPPFVSRPSRPSRLSDGDTPRKRLGSRVFRRDRAAPDAARHEGGGEGRLPDDGCAPCRLPRLRWGLVLHGRLPDARRIQGPAQGSRKLSLQKLRQIVLRSAIFYALKSTHRHGKKCMHFCLEVHALLGLWGRREATNLV